jgi:hypothetical protein
MGYFFIALFVGSIMSKLGVDENPIFLAVFWPIAIWMVIIMLLIFAPIKLGEITVNFFEHVFGGKE